MAARYTISFTNNLGTACVLTISDANHSGAVTALTGAGRSPVVRTSEGSEEDIFAPIVASSLKVTYVNDGTVSVDEFIEGDANRFTCSLTVGGSTVFNGILSVDDLSERVIYTPNEVTLTFTDGLGLLKNYTVSDCDLNPLSGRYRLTDILTSLLKLTGLELPLNAFVNTYETQMANRTAGATNDPLYQAGINIKSFLSNSTDEDKWETVYDAVEKIMKSWDCKLFQDGGKWQVVEVDSLVGNKAGTAYDTTGTATGGLTNQFTFVTDLTATERSQVRFFKRAAREIIKTFNYRFPQLFVNANLQRLGTFISSFVDGDNTISRYEAYGFTENNGQVAEIRVVRNTTTGREVERYLWLEFEANFSAGAIGEAIEVDEGDTFKFSFRFRADSDSNFGGYCLAGFFLDGYNLDTYELSTFPTIGAGRWFPSASVPTNFQLSNFVGVSGGDDLTDYRAWDIDDHPFEFTATFPTDSLLYIGFGGFNNTRNRWADKNAYIKDIKFEYIKTVSDSIVINGQEHKISQTTDFNNSVEYEVYIDDSPATSIRGTLFYMDGTTVPNRTESWSDDETNFYRFGEVKLKQQIELDGITRYVLQGTFRGIPTLMNRLQFAALTGRTFYPLRLITDYAAGVIDGTFAEIDGPNTMGASTYAFRYLYD